MVDSWATKNRGEIWWTKLKSWWCTHKWMICWKNAFSWMVFYGTNQATSRQIEKSVRRGLLPTLTVEESCCGLLLKIMQEMRPGVHSYPFLPWNTPMMHRWWVTHFKRPDCRTTFGERFSIACSHDQIKSSNILQTPGDGIMAHGFCHSHLSCDILQEHLVYMAENPKLSWITFPILQLVHCKQDRNAVHLALQTGAMPGRKVRITKRPLQSVWQA